MDTQKEKITAPIQNDDNKSEENININPDSGNKKGDNINKSDKNSEETKNIIKTTENNISEVNTNKVNKSENKKETNSTEFKNEDDNSKESGISLEDIESLKKNNSYPSLSHKSSASSLSTPKSILRRRKNDGDSSDGSADDVSSISSLKKKHIEFSDDNIVYTLDRDEDYEEEDEDDEAYKGHPSNYGNYSIIFLIFSFIKRYLLFALVITAGICFSYYSYNSNNKKPHGSNRHGGFKNGRKNKPGPPSIQWDKAMNNKETKTVQPIKRIESLTLTEVLSADPTITTSVFQETPTTIVAPGEQQSEDKSDSNISTKEIPKQNKTKEIPKEISKEKKSESTYKRIVAVGDIHGDYKKLMKVLSTAKLVDQKGNWIAKDTILVQTGDLIDRGSDTILIFDLMMKIKKQAEKYNSIVYMLLGNHEVMNLQEDFRYVTRGDVMSFGGMANRKKEFSMEGKYGNLLRNEMNATMIVDDTLFVHAGLISSFAKYGVDQMNNNVHYTLQNYPPHQLFYAPLFSNNGPFWTRFMALGPETPMCEELKIVMDIMKIKRMVVGHTVQENGKINTRCDGKFLMIDVGMSSFYGGGFAYLEIMNDGNEIWAVYSDTERERID